MKITILISLVPGGELSFFLIEFIINYLDRYIWYQGLFGFLDEYVIV